VWSHTCRATARSCQDGAYNQRFSTTYLSVPDPRSFILPREFEALGSAMGQAIGAAFARPDRVTVLCTATGDS
jgi:thiamine pyrophosphate-dependent acetolactate synthase large subunit-like protein